MRQPDGMQCIASLPINVVPQEVAVRLAPSAALSGTIPDFGAVALISNKTGNGLGGHGSATAFRKDGQEISHLMSDESSSPADKREKSQGDAPARLSAGAAGIARTPPRPCSAASESAGQARARAGGGRGFPLPSKPRENAHASPSFPSQGGPGQGSKETRKKARHVLDALGSPHRCRPPDRRMRVHRETQEAQNPAEPRPRFLSQ